MFSPMGYRRGFPRQPGPWQAGPPPPRPYGFQNTWDEMPQHRRGRGQWCPPWFSEPRRLPGPDDFHGNEENRRWGLHDRSPPRHWDNEECDQGPEVCFEEGWLPEMMPPNPNYSAWPEFPNERHHPPCPPTHQTEERDGFQDGCRPWGFRGPARRHCQRLRRGHRRSAMVLPPLCHRPRGYWPPSRSSPCSGMSQPVVKEEPQPLTPIQPGVQSREQQAEDLPAASQKVPKCPRATSTSQKSLAADPQVVTEAVEPEQAAGAMLVEPCSQSSPEAGAGSHPCSPTAPPEPAEPPQGQQCKAEAASAGVLPGSPTEPKIEPREASSYVCIKQESSPGTQHPPGSSEVKQPAGDLHQLCSRLPKPSPGGTDRRSAAVLARKEKIELSYQQFSLTIAVVATMLLQKEPSMEAALGPALRANLRQGRIHHIQELEDFINSYDSVTPGC